MDDFSINDLDSSSLEIVQKVQQYKKCLDEALGSFNDQISGEQHLPLQDIVDFNDENFDSIKSQSEENLKEGQSQQMNVDQVRLSIKQLLTVTEPFPNLETVVKEKPVNERLHQRLNHLSEMYKQEDCYQPTQRTVLQEQNKSTYSNNLFKDRLKSFAQLYYPVKKSNPVPTKIPQTTSVETQSQPKSIVKRDLFEVENSVKSSLKNEDSKEVPMKQTSVADLKKIFETKINENVQETKEMAPELLPVKEKKRLFEMAIRIENEARAKQYRKETVPIKKQCLIVKRDSSPSKESEFEKSNHVIPKISQNDLNPTIERNLSESKNLSSSYLKPVNEIEINEEVEECDPIENSMEITFTAIDCQDKEILRNLSNQSLMESIGESADSIHRSSTRVDLKESQSEEEDLPPEKPPRTYEYDAEIALMESLGESADSIHRSSTHVDLKKSQSEDLLPPEKTLPTNEYDDEMAQPTNLDEPPPMRTISFYRREQKKQQEQAKADSLVDKKEDDHFQVIHLRQKLSQESSDRMDLERFRIECQQKMVELHKEISQHNRVLNQAGKALELSLSRPELRFFEGRLEAERLLLVSSEKKNACLNEIIRLKSLIHNADQHLDSINAVAKGTLYIPNIKIPLLNKFLVARAKNQEPNDYYFICLICNGPNVFVSDLLNTNVDLSKEFLEFDLDISIPELDDDFNIVIKLYSLQLSRKDVELGKSSKLAPFRSIGRKLLQPRTPTSTPESPLSKPISGSEGNLSSNSNFRLVGYVPLTLKNVKAVSRNKFYRLDSEYFPSIIDNYLVMNLHLKVMYINSFQGYFDMQEQSTTFWNLRWFLLEGNKLMYWRFDVDRAKPAIGTINLKHCVNPSVGFLKPDQRHICMRANTFPLVTIDPPLVSNTQKLLKGGDIRVAKPKVWFISSQSKEDSLKFCLNLNKTLCAIRLWETDFVQPYSVEEFDRLLINL